MSRPLLKNYYLKTEEIVKIWEKAWLSVYFSPSFILRKIKNLRNFKVLKLYIRGIISVLIGHLRIFKKNEC
jgi:hypothetical protein